MVVNSEEFREFTVGMGVQTVLCIKSIFVYNNNSLSDED